MRYLITDSNTLSLYKTKDFQFKTMPLNATFIAFGDKQLYAVQNSIVKKIKIQEFDIQIESELTFPSKVIFVGEAQGKLVVIEENGKITKDNAIFKTVLETGPNQSTWIHNYSTFSYLSVYFNHILTIYSIDNDLTLLQKISIKRIISHQSPRTSISAFTFPNSCHS